MVDDDTLVVNRVKKKAKKKDKLDKRAKETKEVKFHQSEGRIPLKMQTKCVATDDVLLEHIKKSLKLKLPEFTPYPPEHGGVIVLVGSGPTVEHEVESIRAHKKKGNIIVAIKGAHDWLIHKGIKPDWCVMLDPQEKIVNCIETPQDAVVYFIASQCHPAVFKQLKDKYIVLWHALSGIGEKSLLKRKVLLGGGTTTGLRALNLVYTLGYRKVHLYGYDSSATGKEDDWTKRVNGDKCKRVLDVWVGQKQFFCNPAMAAQANEFQTALSVLKGLKVNVHGDSLIHEIWTHHIGMGGDAWFED